MAIRVLKIIFLLICQAHHVFSEPFTIVEYNCENLFDVTHDSLKNDYEFLPDSKRQWTWSRMYRKANDIARVIHQCGGTGKDWTLPDMVALVEVENDSVMQLLTRRTMLREAGYQYIITDSDDPRGIDVALLYNPFTIKPLKTQSIPFPNTRSILYAMMQQRDGDTLHVYVVHAPSRRGGQTSDKQRKKVITTLLHHIEGLSSAPIPPTSGELEGVLEKEGVLKLEGMRILILGDFNEYSHVGTLRDIEEAGLREVSADAVGIYHPEEVLGTYYFRGEWNSLDHIFVSPGLLAGSPYHSFILDADWLLDSDSHGNRKPRRSYLGPSYHGGVSDHLPLILNVGKKK